MLECTIPLGICVHMTPVFETIKCARPEIRVSVATWGIGLQVLRNSPYIDDLIEIPAPSKNFSAAVSSLKGQLRSRGLKPDCCFTGTADQSTRWGIFASLVCSGWRGGMTLVPALYQRPLRREPTLSQIENNLQLATLLGIAVHPLEPKVFYSNEDADAARTLLEPARRAGRPVLIAATRGSGGLPTAWHEDRWAETLAYAHHDLGYQVLCVGTAADAPAIAALIRMAGGSGISLAGKTSINQLAALLALSDMVISINTGTLHVARAVRTPLIVLNMAWEKPLEWMPSPRPDVRDVQGPFLETIPDGYRMDEISVDWVTSELADMTRLFPPDNSAREARLNASLSEVDHLRSS